jgi:hypothetical protein
VRPSSKLTSAAISKVHRLVCLPNSLGELCARVLAGPRLGIESSVNGMRTLGALLKRLWKPLLVEDVDGVARGLLGVAPEALRTIW